jgi:hypothetical protein
MGEVSTSLGGTNLPRQLNRPAQESHRFAGGRIMKL